MRRRTGGRRRRWVVLWLAAAAAAWLYGRRRRRRQTGWESSETEHSLGRRFFLVLQGLATSPVISAGPLAPKTKLWIYTLCAQFHSRNELIVYCLISGGSYKCNVECWGDADSAGVENAELENAGLENTRIKNMPSFELVNERTRKSSPAKSAVSLVSWYQ